MQKISLLGSTGSIGTSTLALVDEFPDKLKVVAMAAGENVTLFAEQIRKVRPAVVSMKTEALAKELRELLGADGGGIEILSGAEGASTVATVSEAATVVAGIVGAAGIAPVHAALLAGKRVGIANKEVLVAAGDVMEDAAKAGGGVILPIDSEHCAVHQALTCGRIDEVQRIILTASGGPFLHKPVADLASVSVEQALAHPTWSMGNKISIDSATMMNKGLEVIEAYHLFGKECSSIDIVIHPQSIVHSMVEYIDGSIIAQLSTTDMKFPIQYVLTWPERVATPYPRLDLTSMGSLEFFDVEHDRFPAVKLAYRACEAGGSMPAVLNAANEIAVERFLASEIGFMDIVRLVESVMDAHVDDAVAHVGSIEEALSWNQWARNEASERAVAFRY